MSQCGGGSGRWAADGAPPVNLAPAYVELDTAMVDLVVSCLWDGRTRWLGPVLVSLRRSLTGCVSGRRRCTTVILSTGWPWRWPAFWCVGRTVSETVCRRRRVCLPARRGRGRGCGRTASVVASSVCNSSARVILLSPLQCSCSATVHNTLQSLDFLVYYGLREAA